MNSMNKLLTINQVAELLQVSRPTVYEYMDDKKHPLPVIYLGDRTPRFRKSDIEAWLQAKRQSNIPAQSSDSVAAGGEDSEKGGEK